MIRQHIIHAVLMLGCLVGVAGGGLLACQESLPVESLPEPEPLPPSEPFVDLRNWTTPSRISVLPEDILRDAYLTSISAGKQGGLHLLLNIPADTLERHDLYRLAYFYFDGAMWSHKTEMEGFGIFKPSASVEVEPNRVHFVWAGVAPEYRQSPPTHRATDLYHCVWDGVACSDPVSVHSTTPYGIMVFFEMVVDQQGTAHLLIGQHTAYHLTIDKTGVRTLTEIGGGTYSRISMKDDVLHYAYVSASPNEQRSANDLFYKAYRNGAWTLPVTVFQEDGRLAHVPAIVEDNEGVLHMVWITEVTGDREPEVTTWHAWSDDEGKTWSEPYTLYTMTSIFAASPTLVVDQYNTLHLTSSHYGSLPFVDNFYASYRDGSWSEPQVFFPELPSMTPVFMALDAANVVHAVWQNNEKIYHSQLK